MPRQVFDGETCQLATRIPGTLHRAVKIAALEDGVPIQEWVAEALAVYLGDLGGNPVTAAAEHARKRRPGPRVVRARASV